MAADGAAGIRAGFVTLSCIVFQRSPTVTPRAGGWISPARAGARADGMRDYASKRPMLGIAMGYMAPARRADRLALFMATAEKDEKPE